MTATLVLLAAAYAAVAALLLNLLLVTRYSMALKATAILLVSLLYGGTWSGLWGLTGWASPEPLPEEFRVLWLTVDEVDKTSGEPGAIFLWVRELDAAGLPVGEPRAHRVPWSEEAAEAAQDALERLEEGELLNGRLGRGVVSEQRESETGDYAGEESLGSGLGEQPLFEFVRVPPPTLPPKSAQGPATGRD